MPRKKTVADDSDDKYSMPIKFSRMEKGKLAVSSSINNASVVESFQANLMGKDVEILGMISMLEKHAKEVNQNDLSSLESMLVGQAIALQSIFASLSRRAAVQDRLPQYQVFMSLALKAQSQSRSTIAALVDIKNPKQSTYVGQTNLNTGSQQIHNTLNISAVDQNSREMQIQLSGTSHGLLQNSRTQSFEVGINSSVEAMVEVNGAKV